MRLNTNRKNKNNLKENNLTVKCREKERIFESKRRATFDTILIASKRFKEKEIKISQFHEIIDSKFPEYKTRKNNYTGMLNDYIIILEELGLVKMIQKKPKIIIFKKSFYQEYENNLISLDRDLRLLYKYKIKLKELNNK